MSSRHPGGATRTARRPSFTLILVLVILLGMVIVSVGIVLIPTWDDIGVEGRECTVTGAEASTSGGGRSPTLPVVRIETSDCGALGWQQGVTFDNSAQIAATFTPGVYEIRMGWFSRVVMPILPDGLPTVRGYELLHPNGAEGAAPGRS